MKKQQAGLVTAVISSLALGAIGCSGGGTGGGTGGTTGTGDASALCSPPIASMDSVISDFKTSSGVNPVQGRTGGWYVYYEGDADAAHPNTMNPRLDPPKSTSGPPISTTVGGPCSGAGSLRQKATGVTGWGVGLGTNIAAAVSGKHGSYDASAYTGVRMWMKCAAPTMHVSLKIPTSDTDFDAPAPMCTSYSDCNAHGKYDVPLTADWTVFEVPFADAIQDPGNPSTTRIPTFDKSKITAIQIQINANYVDGGAVPNDFECWFDDLHFY